MRAELYGEVIGRSDVRANGIRDSRRDKAGQRKRNDDNCQADGHEPVGANGGPGVIAARLQALGGNGLQQCCELRERRE